MITEWNREIAIAWDVLNHIKELDVGNIWEYHPPRPAATERDVRAVEEAIGHRLDPRYRGFLAFANGWECFYHDVTLFGTAELLAEDKMYAAQMRLGEMLPEEPGSVRPGKSAVLPMAVSATDRDVFVITRGGGRYPSGAVIWFAGGEIERFPTFDEFFLAMIDCNRHEYQDFLREKV